MKRVLLLCLIGIAILRGYAATNNPPEPVQPFTAVFWTTTTLHSPAGKASVFLQRTVVTRDSAGKVRREIYRPTKGLLHDTTAPLERVVTGSTSAQTRPPISSGGDTQEQDVDLGTLPFSGVPATGRRQIFHDSNGQLTHTLDTWFSATLGLTVHMESSNARRDTTVLDLSEVRMGNPATPSPEAAPAAAPAIPLLTLYRALFTQIAHMERDRHSNDPNFHVNMNEIEDHLRTKLVLSAGQWQVLVDKSVKVDSYTQEMAKEARSFAEQDKAARRANPLGPNTLANGRATLHKMQLDLNTHVQGEIDDLKAVLGADATKNIQAYLQGPLAASTSVVHLNPAQLRAQKEQLR